MGQVDLAVFRLGQQVHEVQVGDDFFACRQHRQALVRSSIGIQRSVFVEDGDHRQALALADLVIVRVVRGGDLHAAGAQLGFCPLVRHQGHRPVQKRQHHLAAVAGHVAELDQFGQERLAAVAHVVQFGAEFGLFLFRSGGQPGRQLCLGFVERRGRIGVHRHGRIAEHRLRPGGRHRHSVRLARPGVDHRIVHVPEMPRYGLVKDFVVGHGRLQHRVPVHQPFAAVDEPVAKQPVERVSHGAGADRIEREPRAVPVAATAHLLELAENAGFVLLLPCPDACDQPFTA